MGHEYEDSPNSPAHFSSIIKVEERFSEEEETKMEAPVKIDHFQLKASPLGRETQSTKCGECDDYDGPELEQHLAFVHGLFSPYPCRYCGFTNRRYGVLKFHMRKKHKTRRGIEGFFMYIRCAECTEYNGPNISEHLKNVHGLRSPFQCSRCLYKTRSYVTFKNHRSTHCHRLPKLQRMKSTKCWDCDDYNGPELIHHLAQAHAMTTPFKCSTCSKVFSSYGNLIYHRKVHGQAGPKPTAEIKCEECEEYEGKQVYSHLKTVHGLLPTFQCPHCQYSTEFYTNYKSHRASHMPTEESSSMINQDAKGRRRLTKCEECDDYDGTELYSHLLEAHNLRRSFKCSMCYFTAKTYSSLKQHRRSCSRSAAGSKRNNVQIPLTKEPLMGTNRPDMIKCEECNEHDGLNVYEHLQNTHSISPPFKCSECDYITDFYTNFKIHHGSHSPDKIQERKGCERPWKCYDCDEYDGPELYAHLSDAHEMRKPFKCFLCDKANFTRYGTLVSHRKSHLKVRSQRTKCDECDYDGADLEVHLEHNHGITSPYKCNHCKYQHKNYSSLVTHRETHKKKMTKCEECQEYEGLDIYEHLETTHGMSLPFPCSICSKTFMSYSRLKRHHDPRGGWCDECDAQIDTDLTGHLESVHQLKSPFICHICNSKSQTYCAYRIHKQTTHGRKKKLIQVQSSRKATKCWECTDHDGPNLMEHLESVHGIQSPFKCPDCTFTCKFYSRFSEHRKSHVQHKCKICGTRYDFEFHLTAHMEKKHGQPKPKTPPWKQSQVILAQPYTCSYCGFSMIKVEPFKLLGLNETQKCPICESFLPSTKLGPDGSNGNDPPNPVQMAPEILNVTNAPMEMDMRNGEDIHIREIQTHFKQEEGSCSAEISPTEKDSNYGYDPLSYDPLNDIKPQVSQFEIDLNNQVEDSEAFGQDEEKIIGGQDFFCMEEAEPLFI